MNLGSRIAAAGPEILSVAAVTTSFVPSATLVTPSTFAFQKLTGFTPIDATGTVRYQLSRDGGTNWLTSNGATWVKAAPTVGNTAAEISSQLANFPAGTLAIKAFLTSAGGTADATLRGIDVSYLP